MAGTQETLEPPIAEGRVALVYPWEDGKVLKLARDWVPPDWLAHEYRISSIVHGTGLPIPRPHLLTEYNGLPAIIYDRVDGPTMLDRIAAAPHQAASLGRMLGKLHAEMHTRTGITDLPDNSERLQGRIESIREAPEIYRQTALQELAACPRGEALLHGDFHPGNVILARGGPVVIDWPDASRGHPLADVARTIVLINMGGLPPNLVLRALVTILRNVFKRAYLRAYFRRSNHNRKDLNRWLYPVIFARFAEGIESERDLSLRWLERLIPTVKENPSR